MRNNIFFRFFQRLHNSENSEYEQGYVRLLFVVLSATYLFIFNSYDTATTLGIIFAVNLIYCVAVLIWIAIKPVKSIVRYLTVIFIDISMLSTIILSVSEESKHSFFFVYLWVIIGYAFRFGERYMWLGVFFSLTMYLSIIYFQDIFKSTVAAEILSLFVIPFYAIKFIRKTNASLDDAFAANQSKNTFMGVMSHEIRNPLNSIIILSDLLYELNLKGKASKYAKQISQSGSQLLHFVNGILEYTSNDSSNQPNPPTVLSLPEIIDYSISLSEKQIAQKQLAVTSRFPLGTPKYVYGHEVKLRQLFTNLITNAIKFTDNGSVTINISKAHSNIENKFTVVLLFEIEDTGIGIDADQFSKIFETFSQANGSDTHQYRGTGLGLAICKKIMTALGSTIKIKSIPGKGSTFWFELEFKKASKEDYEKLEENKKTSLSFRLPSKLSILIAEDNADNQFAYEEILLSKGCAVDIASDGNEAIQKLMNFKYDVAIIDHEMPFYSGYKVMKFYREEIGGNTKLILLSADISDETKKLYGSLPDVIETKPIKPALLVSLLYEQTIDLLDKENYATKVGPSSDDDTVSEYSGRLDLDMIESNAEYIDPIEQFNVFTTVFDMNFQLLKESISNAMDKKQIIKNLHSLESGSGQAGAKSLSKLIQAYKRLLIEVDPSDGIDDLESLLKHINNKYRATCREFHALFSTGYLSSENIGAHK